MMIGAMPAKGTAKSNNHHPEKSMSCSRLTVTATPGSKRVKEANTEKMPSGTPKTKRSTIVKPMVSKVWNSTQNQNSGRPALPLNAAYLPKQIAIA